MSDQHAVPGDGEPAEPEGPADRPAASEGPAEPARPEEEHDAPDATERRLVDTTTARRAPRYGRFVLVGILAGAALALVLALLPIGSSTLGVGTLFALLLLTLGFLGAVAGAVVALLLDRRSLRRR